MTDDNSNKRLTRRNALRIAGAAGAASRLTAVGGRRRPRGGDCGRGDGGDCPVADGSSGDEQY